MLDKTETNKVLTKFSKYVVTQSRANLTRKDKNVKGKLYQSIKGETFTGKNSIGIYFEMEDYGEFQDKGVKGVSSSAKAPDSPYRFGSGTGRKGGLTQGINQWVRDRRFQFRDKESNRFLSYEQTAFLITRSIYQKGIEASRFFSKPFEVGFGRLPNELIEAYGLDLEKTLQQSLNK
jgi:hypothetical protein